MYIKILMQKWPAGKVVTSAWTPAAGSFFAATCTKNKPGAGKGE